MTTCLRGSVIVGYKIRDVRPDQRAPTFGSRIITDGHKSK
jgi:hypothetical protein